MQIVLLSGGSGKRLWPLSNDARSKQFLPLLEREDGTKESMVQRVVRQIRENGLAGDCGTVSPGPDGRRGPSITIATNISQKDIIINQLGEDVDIVTEPERRDTFPAIALASCYLRYAKACPDDEIVVVMPCDPYTEAGYFRAIAEMAGCVRDAAADLVLMGITPTCPSEKFGYVVPEQAGARLPGTRCLKVSKFTEKPTSARAEELLGQGALWNGGVFAFRLGYMMDIVGNYLPLALSPARSREGGLRNFESIRGRYSAFPKISFDYEVVEKAGSVAVVPYSGKWKDLGTWNSLTEELGRPVTGNAVMGPDCENTHVINELQQPIYVDGLRNVVVAACPDGILVCGKEQSERIRDSVAKLSTRYMYEERRWGTYRVLDDTSYADGHHSLTKIINLNPGKNISYQIHHHRSEVWTFIQGEGIFVLDGVERIVRAGDTVIVPVRHYHAIKAVTALTFIEVQIGNPLTEEDIERFDWDWGR